MLVKIYNLIKNYLSIPKTIVSLIVSNKKKVAVIGNSEILSKKKYGKIIDKHDFVIRFNRSPVLRYKKIVGSKTHLRVCGEGVFENKEYKVIGLEYLGEKKNYIKNLKNSNILVLHNKEEKYYSSNIKKYTSETNKIFYFNLKYERFLKFKIFSHLTFFRRIKLFKSSTQFTSGMMIISILILNNIKPSIFGFSLKKKSSFYKSYWQKGAEIKKPVHDLELENKLLKKFITLKKITYYN